MASDAADLRARLTALAEEWESEASGYDEDDCCGRYIRRFVADLRALAASPGERRPRDLNCPKCDAWFEDPDPTKDFSAGIICPECPGAVKGVIHPGPVRAAAPVPGAPREEPRPEDKETERHG